MLNNKQSLGIDNIRVKDIKLCLDEITPVLMKLINLFLRSGSYPALLKQAVLRPVYRLVPGDHRLLSNYRPIFFSFGHR